MALLSSVKWKSWAKAGFLALIFCLILILFADLQIDRIYSESKHSPNPDELPDSLVAIIPGAAVHGKIPSPILSDRLQCGLDLYRKRKVKKILLSGDNGQSDYNELRPMLDFMLKNEVSPEDIFVDHAGFRTLDTLIRAKEVFLVEEAIFVSQSFFLPRAVYLGKELNITLHAYECNLRSYKKENFYEWREFFARQLAYFDIIFDTPPKFLGDKYPIMGSGVNTWKGSIQ